MSQSAAQYAAFWRDVARQRRVWTLRDAQGFPAPPNGDGQRTMPFWSSASRVERVIRSVPAYAGFTPHELTWEEFRDHWLPGLARDGVRVGVNWSGPRATGYDCSPAEIAEAGRRLVDASSPTDDVVPPRDG